MLAYDSSAQRQQSAATNNKATVIVQPPTTMDLLQASSAAYYANKGPLAPIQEGKEETEIFFPFYGASDVLQAEQSVKQGIADGVITMPNNSDSHIEPGEIDESFHVDPYALMRSQSLLTHVELDHPPSKLEQDILAKTQAYQSCTTKSERFALLDKFMTHLSNDDYIDYEKSNENLTDVFWSDPTWKAIRTDYPKMTKGQFKEICEWISCCPNDDTVYPNNVITDLMGPPRPEQTISAEMLEAISKQHEHQLEWQKSSATNTEEDSPVGGGEEKKGDPQDMDVDYSAEDDIEYSTEELAEIARGNAASQRT
jgi:hypothetical protein